MLRRGSNVSSKILFENAINSKTIPLVAAVTAAGISRNITK
jgi:hypothetical protein